MKKEKYKYIIITFIVVIVLFFILNKDDKETSIVVTNNNIDNNLINSWTGTNNNNNWNYYENTSINKSTEIENIDKKLQEEWKIEWTTLYFDRNWFKSNWEEISFKQNSNIKLEINAWDTWLKEGTQLKLSIPWAWVETMITIPWRYKYSIFFNKWWEQKIILTWKWLRNSKIIQTINLK